MLVRTLVTLGAALLLDQASAGVWPAKFRVTAGKDLRPVCQYALSNESYSPESFSVMFDTVRKDFDDPLRTQSGRAWTISPREVPARNVLDVFFDEGARDLSGEVTDLIRLARGTWTDYELGLGESALAYLRGETPGRTLVTHYTRRVPGSFNHWVAQTAYLIFPSETFPAGILFANKVGLSAHEYLAEVRYFDGLNAQAYGVLPIVLRPE